MADDDHDPFDLRREPEPWWGFTTPGVHPCTGFDPTRDLGSLQDVVGSRPTERSAPKPVQLSTDPKIWISLTTSDGMKCAGVAMRVRGEGLDASATTDQNGEILMSVPADGIYEVEIEDPIAMPAVDNRPTKTPIWTRKITRDATGFALQADVHQDVVVIRPAVTEVLLDGWAQGSSVMRWGGTRVRKDKTVGTARGALQVALWSGRGRTMCITGHADPLGSDEDNTTLADARAKSVWLFTSGDLDGWAADAAAHATELDWSCALVAAARIMGMGACALDDGPALAAAISEIRTRYGISHNEVPGVDEWRAIADLYDTDLAELLLVDRAELAATRSTIAWTDPPTLSLGEQFPRPDIELLEQLAGPVALAQRRVGLCIFGPNDTAQLAADRGGKEIYDGTYSRTSIDPPGEVLVEIQIADPKLSPISRGRAWIGVGKLGVFHMTAAADGVIRFPCLRGEQIRVVAAFDEQGLGTMMTAGVKEI